MKYITPRGHKGLPDRVKKVVCAQLHQITFIQLTYRRKQLHKSETELCVCTAAAQTWHCAAGVRGVQEMSISERGD